MSQKTLSLNSSKEGVFIDDQLVYTNSIGHALIQEVQIEVGGQIIDKHYGVWLEIWDELTQTAEKEAGFY